SPESVGWPCVEELRIEGPVPDTTRAPSEEDGDAGLRGDGQVLDAIPVEVTRDQVAWTYSHGVGHSCAKRPVAHSARSNPQENRHGIGCQIRDGQIEYAISIEVERNDVGWRGSSVQQ